MKELYQYCCNVLKSALNPPLEMDVDIPNRDEKAGKYFMRLRLNIFRKNKCFKMATNIRYVNYLIT